MSRKQSSILLLPFYLVLQALIAFDLSAAETFAWQDTNTYRPPNFEATFPLDRGGRRAPGPALQRPRPGRNGG
jgi:hypothetical protein